MTLFPNYHRAPVTFTQAQNATWFDDQGQAYSDLTSGIGVYNIGATHPKVVAALTQQAEKIWHIPNLYQNPLQEAVAQQLGGNDYTTYFANSGAEANEAAIKLARLVTGKSTIISFTNSFHGRTYAAMSATGQDSIHAGLPMLTGFTYAKFNDITSVKALITDDTAAIMLELVQGEGGVFPADPAFVAELVNLAKTNGILLLVDEVQTGMGRTGTRFAFEQYGFTPDIFTTAKGLANGIPVGAMLAKNDYAEALAYGTHGSTFGGNPLVMSAAQATLTVLDEVLPTLPEKIALFWDKLAEFKTLAVVDDVRGLGMMAGIALTVPVEQVVADLLAAHIIVLSAGHNTLRLLPPLTIPTAQLLETLDNIKIKLDKI
ncbi:aminotransferase class III-fold pyridoxal phosphate-dependent enzyme [Leuconostoc lactis]|uniref:Aminotransferase class III-fold pyridoxal phosphate-dependent enzyme n=1 Tax=Leuconostoc lactis TaxID=1246 RepID=A0AAP9JA78_LEULA|nr:acetylornithine transaminase [Leuconostoc lactis]MCC2745300.1 acetylornithine transaminase [Leuconostoc lactis]MCC2755836.1 acetylornithine transaminase [Leuconostoc lactis]QEA43824.1 aminotransferase class III-fold pyridoxal phosphate-dependent enzyme [Leuconostoc lactis]